MASEYPKALVGWEEVIDTAIKRNSHMMLDNLGLNEYRRGYTRAVASRMDELLVGDYRFPLILSSAVRAGTVILTNGHGAVRIENIGHGLE
jgi:hypothetical protein